MVGIRLRQSTIAKIIAKMLALQRPHPLPWPGSGEFNGGTALLDYRQSDADGVAGSVRFIGSKPTIYHHIAPLLLRKVSDKRDLPSMVYGLARRWG